MLARLPALVALAAIAWPAGGSAEVELREIAHESLRFHTPGTDGLIGTADDVLIECLDPGPDLACGTGDDVNSTPINPVGSTAYAFIEEITPILGFDFILLFGDGTGTLVVDTDQPLGTPGIFPEFRVFARTVPPGPIQYNTDVPGDPHRIEVFADQTFTIEYTQQTCFDTPDCSPPNLLLDLTGDLIGRGVLLFRGQDPEMLRPALDPSEADAAVDYLGFLTTIVPDDWSAIALTAFGPALLTPDNTRGLIAGALHDGTFNFVTPLVAVPEPGEAAALCACVALFAGAARRRFRPPSH